jgi:predicted Zn-dependent peptidase
MVRDNPSDIIFNHFYEIIFNNHPLSLFILGTYKSLKRIENNSIRDYFDNNFNLDGIVLSAAGNIDHNELVCKVRQNTEGYINGGKRMQKGNDPDLHRYRRGKKIYKSNMKSNYLCYGSVGCSRSSRDRYPLSLFTNILGGSMSSRLFQKIREEKGLAYTVFASNSQYSDTGVIVIYSATSNTSVHRILDLINSEIIHISKKGISKSELEIAKENTKGNIVLGVEDISSRMFRLGKALLMDGKVLTIDEILKRIDKVRIEQVNDIVKKYFQIDKMSTVIIGKEKIRRPK